MESGWPNAVLIDYRLPDIGGLDLLKRAVEQDLPAVMLTIEENPEIIVEAMKRGAQDYLVKRHLSSTSLDRAITNAIEKVALRGAVAAQQQQLVEQTAILEQQNRQIRNLASALTLAEQRERRRIAQILHDDIQQMLYGVQVKLHLLSQNISPNGNDVNQKYLDEIEQFLSQIIELNRTLTVDLSPPVLQEQGLGEALGWLINRMREVHNLKIDLDIQTRNQPLDVDLQVLIFHLVRELLFNVIKHAGVKEAEVKMHESDGMLIIQVRDKGIGFDPSVVHERLDRGESFGLYSVRERLNLFGGRLDIDTEPGSGALLRIVVPGNSNLSVYHHKLAGI
jgi:signal transduction histidine kinase